MTAAARRLAREEVPKNKAANAAAALAAGLDVPDDPSEKKHRKACVKAAKEKLHRLHLR